MNNAHRTDHPIMNNKIIMRMKVGSGEANATLIKKGRRGES